VASAATGGCTLSPGEPPWKVVLVVEDDSDGHVLKALMETRFHQVAIDWVPANGIGEIRRRGPHLIELAKARIRQDKGCVAVVVDRDGLDPQRDEPYRGIATICQAAGVPLILCREAIEACFLADPGGSEAAAGRRSPRATLRRPGGRAPGPPTSGSGRAPGSRTVQTCGKCGFQATSQRNPSGSAK